jgi:DNA-binding CsgD family transcriptional regulator
MLALLALNAARLGSERKDDELLTVAERSADEAKRLTAILPGHAPWGAQAEAALTRVALARDRLPAAVEFGKAALAAFDITMLEDPSLEIVLPAADAILKGGSKEDVAAVQDRLNLTLAILAQRILDENIRVRWFRSPVGRELTQLAGSAKSFDGAKGSAEDGGTGLAESEVGLLRLLTEGRTNREIADELGMTEDAVTRQLTELFAKIGVSSRAEATAVALMGKIV